MIPPFRKALISESERQFPSGGMITKSLFFSLGLVLGAFKKHGAKLIGVCKTTGAVILMMMMNVTVYWAPKLAA